MAQDTNNIPELQSPFEQLREVDADGKEWWNSRKLARVMGYGKYWNFERVIAKAQAWTSQKGYHLGEHFVEITDPLSPITKDIDAKWMNVFDDLFSQVIIHPEAKIHVLASIYDDVENYRVPGWPPAHHPVDIPDGKLENMPGVNEYTPVIWTNEYGKGRVFVTSIGHWEALDRFNFITMLVRGTEWAASGEVTLGRPNRSGDNRLKLFPYY